MDIKEIILKKKNKVITYLSDFLKQKADEWKTSNQWAKDAPNRIDDFASRGKVIRGGIVMSVAELYDVPEKEALPAAAAIELIQIALLAHDDIIDKDNARRGVLSLHKQYETIGIQKGVNEPDHFGVSLSICIGDVALFAAFELLAKTGNTHLISQVGKKLSLVGFGEMEDVFLSTANTLPSEQQILNMYAEKTSMYTFILPLIIGASLGRAKEKDIMLFEKIGWYIGQIFQIRDDEIGITEKGTGKPQGNDLVEGKRTVGYVHVLRNATEEEKQILENFRTKKELNDEEIAQYVSLDKKYGSDTYRKDVMDQLEMQAKSLIAKLDFPDLGKRILEKLITYVRERKK